MSASQRSLWPGLILLILGILFLLDNLEVASFGHIVRTYWPLILIIIGTSILFRRRLPALESHEPQFGSTASASSDTARASQSETSSDTISETSVFGNISVKSVSKNFRGGTLSTVFGSIDVNLTSAELAPGEQHLGANSVFGSVHITLPKDIGLYVRSSCLFGDMTIMNQKRGGIASEIVFKSDNYDTAAKKLNISASQVFGDIKIW